LKKLNVQPIAGVEECNMFKEDGSVLHFSAPKVHAAVTSNTYAIYGRGENKELTELVPGILNQLGPDSLASLRRMAEAYNAQSQRGAAGKEKEPDDDDDIPVGTHQMIGQLSPQADDVISQELVDVPGEDSQDTGATASSTNKLEEVTSCLSSEGQDHPLTNIHNLNSSSNRLKRHYSIRRNVSLQFVMTKKLSSLFLQGCHLKMQRCLETLTTIRRLMHEADDA
jgi:nascent polypeptide-associated complex subunit beta